MEKTLQIILSLIDKNYDSDSAFENDIGIKPKTDDCWKRGESKAYFKMIPQLAKLFNVSEQCFYGDNNIKVYDEHDNIVVIDDETRDIIDSLRTNPEMKILFSVSKKATKEDIIKAVKIIEALRNEE